MRTDLPRAFVARPTLAARGASDKDAAGFARRPLYDRRVPPEPILTIVAGGSHREAGRQVGAARRDVIREEVAFDERIPGGRSRAEQLRLASRYREMTEAAYPWYIDELEGIAEAAEVDPLAAFACMVEEIWYEPYSARLQGRCTDVVAVPPATAGDRVLVGHNNDMPRAYQDQLIGIEWRIEGDPAIFTIGNGLWISCGWNSAGISMTGNELAPLDERVGVPREIQFRSMLRMASIETALGESLRHDRASSYNQVLVASDGTVVNVEGSATAADLSEPDERGHLAHTNHYACERMQRYEGDPGYRPNSAARLQRARALLGRQPPGSVTPEAIRTILSDHEGEPNALCRHPERYGPPDASATAFWWIADLTAGEVSFGRGNPCDSTAQSHAFPT
jgi:isopenicillin-N N-acyltransferase-like protein